MKEMEKISFSDTQGKAWTFSDNPGAAIIAFKYLAQEYLLGHPVPPGLLAFAAGLEKQKPLTTYLALLWRQSAQVDSMLTHVENMAKIIGGEERSAPFHILAPLFVERVKVMEEYPEPLILGEGPGGVSQFLYVR